MELEKIIASISEERFKPFLIRCVNNDEALVLYQKNIKVSQAFYALLSVLEVTLRNKINESCKLHFDTDNGFKKNSLQNYIGK